MKVNRDRFNVIKMLLNSGCPKSEAAKYMKVSEWVIRQVAKLESYEEYEQMLAERNLAYQKKAAANRANKEKDKQKEVAEEPVVQQCDSRQTIVVQASHYMLEEQKKTNELLTSISNKLAFIVEELTGNEKNKEEN